MPQSQTLRYVTCFLGSSGRADRTGAMGQWMVDHLVMLGPWHEDA